MEPIFFDADDPALFEESSARDTSALRSILVAHHKRHEARVEGLLHEHEQRLIDAVRELMSTSPLPAGPATPAPPPPVRPVRPASVEPIRSVAEAVEVVQVQVKSKGQIGPEIATTSLNETERTGHLAWGADAHDDSEEASGSMTKVLPDSSSKQSVSNSPSLWSKVAQVAQVKSRKSFGLFDKEDQSILKQMKLIREQASKKPACRPTTRLGSQGGALQRHASRSSLVAQNVYESKKFEYSVCGLIIANAAFIGAQAHWRMANLYGSVPVFFRIVDLTFIVLFSLEISVRVVAEGANFFSRDNLHARWNLFDTVLVLSSILEEALSALFAEESPDVSAIRLLRLLRLVRVIRVIRVMRFFKDLRVMVAGIFNSVKSLVWAMFLLSLIMYIFGVLFMQVLAEALVKDVPEVDPVLVDKHYGTMQATIYTLYRSISGGIDWGDVAEPLFEANPIIGACFAIYIAFGVFCVLNIITGVFVENANQMTTKDEDNMIMEQLMHRRQWLHEMKGLFTSVGASKNGQLEYQEFEKQFTDVRVQAYFRKFGIDVDANSAPAIFGLFDFNKTGVIDTEEFLTGIGQIHGNARAIDMCKLQHETRDLHNKVGMLVSMMSDPLSRLSC